MTIVPSSATAVNGVPVRADRPAPDPEVGDVPERTCIVTRAKGSPETLLRFALGPDRTVVPDVRGRLPGRGAWVTADSRRVAEAVRRKAFGRAFKGEVAVPADLPEMVDGLLARDALQSLSLVNKAGLIVAGSAKVEALIAQKPVAALVHASDGGADGRRKIEAALRRRHGDAAQGVPIIQIFACGELSLALGRTNVIHAALAVGPASFGFVSRCRRLEQFRLGVRAVDDTAGSARPLED